MKRIATVLLAAILLISLAACNIKTGAKTTPCQDAQALIDQGNISQAYELLRNSNDVEAKRMLENFAFAPLSCVYKGHSQQFTYDNDGNLIKYNDCAGTVREYTYFPNGHVQTENIIYQEICSYITYDTNGNILTLDRTYPHGDYQIDRYTYDEAGQMLSYISDRSCTNNDITEGFAYDTSGNCTSHIKSTSSGTVTNEYLYDDFNRIIYEKKNEYGHQSEHYYEYDDSGNLIRSSTVYQLGPSAKHTYEYDSNNRCIKQCFYVDDLIKYSDTIEYDANGNKTLNERLDFDNSRTRETYQYDLSGNLIEYRRAKDGVTVALTNNTYDDLGQMLSSLIQKQGEDNAYITFQYSNNELGRPTKIIRHMNNIFQEHVEYSYDDFGNIVGAKYFAEDGTLNYEYAAEFELKYYPHGVPECIRDYFDDVKLDDYYHAENG